MTLDRREYLTTVGAVAVSTALSGVTAQASARIAKPPVARVEPVNDTLFGETLTDPYRWMENDKDPEWLPFLKGQNAHTRAVLGTIAGRDRLLKRIEELSGDAATTRLARRTGGMLFFEQRPVGAANFRLL